MRSAIKTPWLLRASGAPSLAVRAAPERARTSSVECEAHLFAHHAERLLADLTAQRVLGRRR
ncbi:hypothetical protein Pth03_75790 [Planotetraspora thailandica]|uniref:Uncharacterized protein n=1 Tax=Planotetraspora thailandica TaxID=487172 RepID=A0A8J4DF98_9ACTN|nr:hypothetical protein Pth03_75790 [Planotetraspora thailandica]